MGTYLEIQVFPMWKDPNDPEGYTLIEEVGQAEFYDGVVFLRDSDTHEIVYDMPEADEMTRAEAIIWVDKAQADYPEASVEWHVDAPMDAATFTLLSALAHQQAAQA